MLFILSGAGIRYSWRPVSIPISIKAWESDALCIPSRRAKLRKLVEAKAEARAKTAAAMPAATAVGAVGADGAAVAAGAAVAVARSRAAGDSVLRRLLSADSAQWVSAEQVSSS